jgi:hypothetical protein
MEGLLVTIMLTGSEAGPAMRKVIDMQGRVLCITPLKGGGETIWFILGNGNICSVPTNRIPSQSGVFGESDDPIENFGEALVSHLKALRVAQVRLGHDTDEMLAIPA